MAISSPGSTSRTNGGPDDVQRRGLAGDHPAARQPPDHQRPEALRVAGRIQGPLVHEHQREGAADQRQGGQCGLLDATLRPGRQPVAEGRGAVRRRARSGYRAHAGHGAVPVAVRRGGRQAIQGLIAERDRVARHPRQHLLRRGRRHGEQRGQHVGVGGGLARPAARAPARAASSRVLVRLPLWPRARLVVGVARNVGLGIGPDRGSAGGIPAVPDGRCTRAGC